MEHELHLTRKLGLWTGIFAVIASMIGSGLFGATGEVLRLVNDPFVTIGLWAFYGVVALVGALCYAELAAMMPHTGGEYVYIRKAFGELPSFLAGWVSFIVGFAAPAAASAFLTAEYTNEFFITYFPDAGWAHFLKTFNGQKIYAVFLIIFFSAIHSINIKKGSYIQNILTVIKVLVVVTFILFSGYVIFTQNPVPLNTIQLEGKTDWLGLGLGMLLVLYAYSGWNGATYLAGEIKNPEINVPRALFWGSLITILLYLMVNIVYFLAVPAQELLGSHTPAVQAVDNLFGTKVAAVFNSIFCIILLSSISAQVMIGPRVYYAMARDGNFFRFAGKVHKKYHTPIYAIISQGILSIVYIINGSFYTVLIYMGFALSIFPVITMLALIKLRYKNNQENEHKKHIFHTKFFPLLPVFFILVSIYLMVFSFLEDWKSCASATTIVTIGIPIYFLWKKFKGESGRKLGF